MMLQSVNPFNNEIIGEFEQIEVADIDNHLDQAQSGFIIWRQTSFEERRNYLKKLAGILKKNKAKYAEILCRETGKVLKEANKEVDKSAMVLEYFAERGEGYLWDDIVEEESAHERVIYEPMGVVLGIMPWNFPFWQFFRFAATTLMAGNSILLKHSSNVPLSAEAIAAVFDEAEFPPGVFQNLITSSSNMNHLIMDHRIQAVSLTGSVAAGAEVAKYAGNNIKKAVLELGGSDPFIVMEDADITKAAKSGVKGRMKNFGQSCDAAKRFILHKDIADKFLSAFKEEMESLKFGDPLNEDSDYACLVSKEQKAVLDKQVEETLQKGAKIYWKGNQAPEEDAFFNPMILTNISNESPAYTEELFGPVASVFVAEDEREAILIANDTRFGLGASIWSNDTERALNLAKEVEAGMVYINEPVSSRPELPFGGIKKSGLGREMAKQGIREFTNRKSVRYK
jgi:succinate-semialdehyde dehydrogenase / glutarate-semialdehyde dehydrogenase